MTIVWDKEIITDDRDFLISELKKVKVKDTHDKGGTMQSFLYLKGKLVDFSSPGSS